MIEVTAVKCGVPGQPQVVSRHLEPNNENWEEVCSWANQQLQEWHKEGQEVAACGGPKWEVGVLEPFALGKWGEPNGWMRFANGGKELFMVVVHMF